MTTDRHDDSLLDFPAEPHPPQAYRVEPLPDGAWRILYADHPLVTLHRDIFGCRVHHAAERLKDLIWRDELRHAHPDRQTSPAHQEGATS